MPSTFLTLLLLSSLITDKQKSRLRRCVSSESVKLNHIISTHLSCLSFTAVVVVVTRQRKVSFHGCISVHLSSNAFYDIYHISSFVLQYCNSTAKWIRKPVSECKWNGNYLWKVKYKNVFQMGPFMSSQYKFNLIPSY